ncbi:MAG: disulfide bond formation protein B [Fulvimarina manganoxydans]|uniref:disulfide bond formation protein B n=1 Tax=Fulvimarina manganoxydans TaxID=937218 RepID=UPI002354F2F9|nr:disulfide bond formation protein B [Fulvimarina manganoxydans]MCK5931597.1 disulfide bond formation protein B [Fulvimarina manganoxydans]
MSVSFLARPVGFRQSAAAIALLIGTTLTVGGALLFEHVGGYMPCALCLTERIPYYVAIPVALIAAIAAAGRARPPLVRLLLLTLGVVMLISLGLGVYHAGVEWGYWPGPTGCSTSGNADLLSNDLLGAIDRIRAPSCNEAAGRFLGLSFAGWNALASAILAAIALRASVAKADRFA